MTCSRAVRASLASRADALASHHATSARRSKSISRSQTSSWFQLGTVRDIASATPAEERRQAAARGTGEVGGADLERQLRGRANQGGIELFGRRGGGRGKKQ